MTIDYKEVEFLLEEKFDILTEDQIQFLLENRIDFIKTANKDKITTMHDPKSAKLSSDQIIDHISQKIDPTKNKTHTQWLTNQYRRGEYKLEDGKAVRKLLTAFTDHKHLLTVKDLNSHKSLADLKDTLALATTKIKNKSYEGNPITEMPKIFEENGIEGFKIPNKATSIKNYGPAGKIHPTSWCTAATNRNMFNGYKGGKYTLHLPNNEVIQLNHQSGQMMDSKDRQVNFSDDRFKPYATEISHFVKKTGEAEGLTHNDSVLMGTHVASEPHEIDAHINDYLIKSNRAEKGQSVEDPTKALSFYDRTHLENSLNKVTGALSNAKLRDDQYELLKKFPVANIRYSGKVDVTPTDMTAKYINNNNFAHPNHIDDFVNRHEGTDLTAVASNHNLSSDTIHTLIGKLHTAGYQGYNTYAFRNLVKNPNLTAEHFTRLINGIPSPEHRVDLEDIAVDEKANIPKELMFKAAAKDDESQDRIAGNPHISPEVAHFIYDHPKSTSSRTYLIQNPAVGKDIVDKVLRHSEELHKLNGSKFLQRDDITPSDIETVLKAKVANNDATMDSTWVSNAKINKSMVKNVIDHPKFIDFLEKVGTTFTENPHVKGNELSNIIAHPKFNANKGNHILPILESPHATSDHLNKLLEKSNDHFTTLKYALDNDSINKNIFTPTHIHSLITDNKATLPTTIDAMRLPNVTMDHFKALESDHKYHGLLSNLETAPPSILHRLASSGFTHVRENVVDNPNTDINTLKILKTDSSPEIAKKAAKRIK